MHQHDVVKPPRVAQLECDPRGYPIFFTIQPPAGRELNFRAVNNEHKRLCAVRRLCGVCGQPLPYRFWFLAGPEVLKDRIFAEPPMHRECMDYALAVCPFLINIYQPLHKPVTNPLIQKEPALHTIRPERLGLFETRGMKLLIERGSILYKADAFTKIEWRSWDGQVLEAV